MAAANTPKPYKGEKIWRQAINRAICRAEKGEKTKRLELLADALVREGIKGDVAALREIGDRLDGKSVQAIQGPNEDGSFTVKGIMRTIIDTKD